MTCNESKNNDNYYKMDSMKNKSKILKYFINNDDGCHVFWQMFFDDEKLNKYINNDGSKLKFCVECGNLLEPEHDWEKFCDDDCRTDTDIINYFYDIIRDCKDYNGYVFLDFGFVEHSEIEEPCYSSYISGTQNIFNKELILMLKSPEEDITLLSIRDKFRLIANTLYKMSKYYFDYVGRGFMLDGIKKMNVSKIKKTYEDYSKYNLMSNSKYSNYDNDGEAFSDFSDFSDSDDEKIDKNNKSNNELDMDYYMIRCVAAFQKLSVDFPKRGEYAELSSKLYRDVIMKKNDIVKVYKVMWGS